MNILKARSGRLPRRGLTAGNDHSQPDVACPGCGFADAVLIGALPDRYTFAGTQQEHPLPGGSLFRCANCSLKFRHPVFSPDFYERLYDNCKTTNWQNESTRNDWARVLAFMQRHVHSDARVLDFGCNTGGLLGQMDPRYRKYGIEVNSSAARLAASSSGAVVWPSTDAIPAGLRFDAIVLADVVEHVADPGRLITGLAEFLDRDGILIITTGDAGNWLWEKLGANWWYCVLPEHIAFTSRHWFDYLARSTQLAVLHLENFRYCDISIARKPLDGFLMLFYGLLPRSYVALVRLVKAMLNRSGDVPVRGVGLSADHLFVVLTNKASLT